MFPVLQPATAPTRFTKGAAHLKMVSATVLVPAYNEEQTIIRLLERVRAQSVDGVQFEVVVVDDASKDSTVARLESRPDLYDHLIKRQQNGGKGAAVRDGLRKASS